jgi:predicted 3-demethylubiquinone-9 3-methyltransferase (glyoxalase superfamily)
MDPDVFALNDRSPGSQLKFASQVLEYVFSRDRLIVEPIFPHVIDACRPEGWVMTVEFEIAGQAFTALNGGPHFKFNEAISFQIACETQEEIDHYWERLSAGGETQQCGWLKNRFGVSWQIFPAALPEMLRDADQAKAARAMRAMLGMKKFDIAELRAAYEGK